MYILTIRTDKPDAEVSLYKDLDRIDSITWTAHRQLAETIHLKIAELLKMAMLKLNDLEGINVFQGPGSFTGLRIGITVANALADSLGGPIVGSQGEEWVRAGISNLLAGKNDGIVIPEYGALPNITAPRK